MLVQIVQRQKKLGLSTRKLAANLEVSPALLSLVINGKRGPSKQVLDRMARWLATPMVSGGDTHPTTVYKEFMAERSSFVSPATLTFYREKLEPFFLWCEKHDHNDITTISRSTIGEFLGHIRQGRAGKPLSNGGLKLHHQTLNTVFNFVEQTREVPNKWTNPVSQLQVKSGNAQRTAFSESEIEQIFDAIESRQDLILKRRDKAVAVVLLNSAMRASELLSMNVADFSTDGRITIVGKGGKRRTVALGHSGVEAVESYLQVRESTAKSLWLSRDGNPMTKSALKQSMARVRREVPSIDDGVFAHRFRHTAITRLLRGGVPLRAVQLYAGHSNPQTTLRYATAIDSEPAFDWINNL
jgi:site-specific recombinase XerD